MTLQPDPSLPARTFSISVRQDWQTVYTRIWPPEMFGHWAAGLANSQMRPHGTVWLADGSDGPITIRFTPQNDFGVMDHFVDTGDGREIHVPLRVVQNGDGTEVMLTLYRQPGMSEERYAADIKLINRDLRSLKALIESQLNARERG